MLTSVCLLIVVPYRICSFQLPSSLPQSKLMAWLTAMEVVFTNCVLCFNLLNCFVGFFLLSLVLSSIFCVMKLAFAPFDDALVPGTERKLSCTSFHLLALIGQNMGAVLLLSFMKFVASVPASRPIFICGLVSDIHRPVRHSIVY